MPSIKHILFPVDFSERCCAAVPFVESVANLFQARVTLLGVAQPMYFTGMGDPTGALILDNETLLRSLKEQLDNALTRNFPGLRVDRFVEIGDPAQIIVEFARTHSVDLIMMPTHGYGPFRGLLLGSVTAKVLHDAECPVWTAAHVADSPCRDHLACRSIICAIDATSASAELILWAASLAEVTSATLRLVHVIPGMQGPITESLSREFEEDRRKEARRRIDEMQRTLGLHLPVCITAGEIAENVAEEARRHKADAVIIGRGAIQEKLGRLRAHDYAIIRQTPCPVFSV